MNIVFLTSESTHHFYLINEVNKDYKVRKVFFQTKHETRSPEGFLKKISSSRRIRRALRYRLAAILFGKEQEAERLYERKMFFGEKTPVLDPLIVSERIRSFNNVEVVERVKKEEPDLIIVFGTEVLTGEILNAARVKILNIHRSIIPKYRGGGLPFWMFYHNDFDHVGTTIHVCTEKLDAGDIVGQKHYKIESSDRLYTLRYKTTLLAVKLLKEIIQQYLDSTVQYRKQEPSKLWTSKELTIFKEIVARYRFNHYLQLLSQK